MTSFRAVPWTGHAIQVFRQKVPGDTAAKRRDWCRLRLDEAVAVGVNAIVWHGFSEEFTCEKFEPLATIARERGLVSLAAYGMDDTDPEGKAHRIAKVSHHPDCVGIVFDWEGRWEDESTDAAKALAFEKVYAAEGADRWRCDQPWWKPTVHTRSPWRQFARIVDARFRQNYCNDYDGKDRFARINTGSEAAWAWLNAKVLKPEELRPVLNTRQAYGWRDIPTSLELCVVTESPVIWWSEPWPDPQVIRALKAAHDLRCAKA